MPKGVSPAKRIDRWAAPFYYLHRFAIQFFFSQVKGEDATMKVKTNTKAGKHCWNAMNDFISCCQGDGNCLR